jgi:crotonobetainyl-CoA:carnitine CoA-transferase CaiB-like acyl-CoA transferase
VAQSALQGLLARERNGKGQLIEVEMLRAAMAIQTTRLAEYFTTGAQPAPMGSAAPTTVPHQAFLCADGKYLAVGVVSEDQWPRLCRAVRLDSLIDDPRFASNPQRVTHRTDLVPILAERFRSKPAAWWILRLTRERVPNGPFLDFQGLRYHPQALASGGITELDTPHWGHLSIDGLPWQFERTPAGPIRAGGLPGEHAAAILAELGIPSAEVH